MPATVRFRHSAAFALAGLTGMVALLPLAGSRWYLTPTLLIPAAVMLWGWRAGTDVDTAGLTVRAALGSRRLRWREITGFTTRGRRVYAVLATDRTVPLPAVTPQDVPRLITAGGQRLDAAELRDSGTDQDLDTDHDRGADGEVNDERAAGDQ